MTRVVLDANVLAPAFVNPTASAGRLLRLWRIGTFSLVTSAPILAELHRTYQDAYYARRLSPELIEAALALLESEAVTVEISVQVLGVASHPEDDLVLATAASANADYLGTRDRQLLKLGSFRGTQIVHPADLARILDSTEDDPYRHRS
ncbi:MAG: putative toxin-antitoxin system toxin component, PIN family [Thermomicrobiales bacterium]|nr:putative toxin-antitoxin system toxin component, PIN family [Thermomicrobiales bacterium]